jgi:hypothetical protein
LTKTPTAQRYVDLQQNKVAVFNLQIAALEKQIDLNNIAAANILNSMHCNWRGQDSKRECFAATRAG